MREGYRYINHLMHNAIMIRHTSKILKQMPQDFKSVSDHFETCETLCFKRLPFYDTQANDRRECHTQQSVLCIILYNFI